jgi:hypothetical protein
VDGTCAPWTIRKSGTAEAHHGVAFEPRNSIRVGRIVTPGT